MTQPASNHHSQAFRIRSFGRRGGRVRVQAAEAQHLLWGRYGLSVESGMIDLAKTFGRVAPCYLEIGFGTGHSLLALAERQPDCDFIGVETYRPAIAALLKSMQAAGVTNLRVYDADVIDVLRESIADEMLSGVQIFFPDPWQKRRHHLRRLIQPPFVAALAEKMKAGAALHLATDWEDYAHHMMQVLSAADHFINVAGVGVFAARSMRRPVITKFEQRALLAGRQVRDLQFQKIL